MRPSSLPAALLLALTLVACEDRPAVVQTFDPGDVEASLPDVVSALTNGDPERALTLLEEHRRAGDVPTGLDHFVGMALVDAGRPEEAEQAFERELADHPGNGQAHMLLAEILMTQGRTQEAAGHLDLADGHRADPIYLALLRGRIALETDDDETAKRAFRDFLQGDRYSARAAEAHHALAQIAEREGDGARAEQHRRTSQHLEQVAQFLNLYRERLEKDPEDSEAALGVGMIYLDLYVGMGADPELALQAEAAFAAALERHPENVKALFDLGYLRSVEGRFDEAATYYERVLAIDPAHSGSLLNLGRIASRKGDLADAETRFEQALDAAVDDAERSQAHLELALLLEGQGRLAQALMHYETCLQLRPGAPPEVLGHIEDLRARAGG